MRKMISQIDIKKHRLFDNDKEELIEEGLDEEENLDKEEKKSSRNKKHRVFDKNKKEKGFLDWLF